MIILMGLAGSGKSTQGQILARELGAVWLSAGQVLRDTDDPKVREIQDRGELVDDNETIELMKYAMAEALAAGKDVILDGYPRTERQANWIADNAADRIKAVIFVEVPKEELMRRLVARGRSDDRDEAAILERFRIVEENISAVCGILTEQGVSVLKVNGVGTVEEVAMRIWAVVGSDKKCVQR